MTGLSYGILALFVFAIIVVFFIFFLLRDVGSPDFDSKIMIEMFEKSETTQTLNELILYHKNNNKIRYRIGDKKQNG